MTMDALASNVLQGAEAKLRDDLFRQHSTDGLPVILPTPERGGDMLMAAAIAGFDRDIVLGRIAPSMGEATIEKVAINAVMAGCGPEHLPVLIAAVQAVCDPRLDMTEVRVTTHHVSPMIMVNGPAHNDCGVTSSFGAMGHGQRANLCIGRALRLCLINLGGAWPGISDMSLLGQPAMLAFCLAEDEEASPFDPLHVSLGLDPEASVATLACVGSARSVIVVTDADPTSADRILRAQAYSIADVGNNNSRSAKGTVVVCLNPDHAKVLHDSGHSRADIQRRLWELAGHPAGALFDLRYGPNHPKRQEVTEPDRFHHAISAPERILVFVAGGPGLYSTVMVPWGGGARQGSHVSKEIILSDACEVAF
ncbi:hypothetical protein GVY41_18250 [Frigidibacter albus]|uniref:Uncharacterized protein n=1 Tax=Frigidibacter albus TaxID=1465486 RepID=A0A6L8VPG8_9RHOB|nr:hypothetical protein [Frigidibacter albus]MZQ91060.1 hypothetical protein [Frigidibacter albus]NBE32945.1 hypothetical protein [Frigidibacter albus]GGH62570.1 hypothetical protein GCM10011341_36880 [Frigidibacter albus]